MAINSSRIPKNAFNININRVLLSIVDNQHIKIVTNGITFTKFSIDDDSIPCMNISYSVNTENGNEISISQITN